MKIANMFLALCIALLVSFGSPALAQDAPTDGPTVEEVVGETDETPTAPEDVPADEPSEPDDVVEDFETDAPPEEVAPVVVDIGDTDGDGNVPDSYEEAGTIVQLLIDAINSKNWPLVVGLGIALLVFVLRKVANVTDYVGEQYVPWITAAFAVLVTLVGGLTTGLPLIEVAIAAITTAAVSIGGILGADATIGSSGSDSSGGEST